MMKFKHATIGLLVVCVILPPTLLSLLPKVNWALVTIPNVTYTIYFPNVSSRLWYQAANRSAPVMEAVATCVFTMNTGIVVSLLEARYMGKPPVLRTSRHVKQLCEHMNEVWLLKCLPTSGNNRGCYTSSVSTIVSTQNSLQCNLIPFYPVTLIEPQKWCKATRMVVCIAQVERDYISLWFDV